jgi:hypothetical protein
MSYKGEFYFSCPIISSAEPISVKEISMADYISLLKFLQNDNAQDIGKFIEYLLGKLVLSDYDKLTVLDKFVILITLRSIILGPEIYFLERATNHRLKTSTEELLRVLLGVNQEFSRKVNFQNLVVELNLPRRFQLEGEDPFLNCITRIQMDTNDYDFLTLTKTEQETIVDHLPPEVIKEIHQHLSSIEKQVESVVLLKTPNLSVHLQLQSDTLFQTLKLLLTDDLKSLYDIAFALISKAHFTWSDILQLNPAELKIFYSKLQADMKEIEDLTKGKQQPSMKDVVDSMR